MKKSLRILQSLTAATALLTILYTSNIPVSANELTLAEIVQLSTMYTYDELQNDINELQLYYPDIVSVSSIGTTALGKDIYCITLGNQDAEHNIMIQSTVHAREYPASQVTMKMVEYYCQYNITNPLFLQSVCFYIVPMANPDGVDIAQFGTAHLTDTATINFVKSQGHTKDWKANAMGVDINRNFDVGWSQLKSPYNSPSYMRYKGAYATSEAETIALVNLATARNYDCYISYHMQGNLIYYDEPGNTKEVSSLSTDLAKTIASINHYRLVNLKSAINGTDVQQGGFTDWVQLALGKPACTVELGSALPPTVQGSVAKIYENNKNTWFLVALNYLNF